MLEHVQNILFWFWVKYFDAWNFWLWKTKRLTAKNEQEATEAHLTETKMQVEATDEAENAKKRIHQSS